MQILCKENEAVLWILESPAIFRRYLQELLSQMQGRDGRFVLSHGDRELDLSKKAELILNPLSVDINDKRFLNKIYAELKELAFGESFYLQTRQLAADIASYFMELEQEACVPLDYEEVDFGQLIKALGTKINEGEGGVVDKLGKYLHVIADLMNKSIVIFVNLSAYLENWEIEMLLQEAFYLKLYVILMERYEIDIAMNKKCYIIDMDHCEIY